MASNPDPIWVEHMQNEEDPPQHILDEIERRKRSVPLRTFSERKNQTSPKEPIVPGFSDRRSKLQ